MAELLQGQSPTIEEIVLWGDQRAVRELDGEQADQFNVWKLAPTRGEAAFVLSWSDSDGRATTYDGLYRSVLEVRAALKARYDAVDVWFEKDV